MTGLEQKMVVVLYELKESGHHIAHDSPAIGAYEKYDPWQKSHGIFKSKDAAEMKKKEVFEEYLKKPFYEIDRNGGLYHPSIDVFLNINEFEVNKKKVRVRGKYFYYNDEKIQE